MVGSASIHYSLNQFSLFVKASPFKIDCNLASCTDNRIGTGCAFIWPAKLGDFRVVARILGLEMHRGNKMIGTSLIAELLN